ncbi:hypothetical protein EVAR_83745_1 [Eumeta japonica]|uniref:Uncharacterized protein n=1 Tax=Eumeta variegata TaxID=151549 RepID=A0A4C1WC43_EUMVA|nr:hypothetical protein EVAR_83745_1 [Eumeta japonica]
MKDDLGQLECDAKSIQRPGDPCHYVPVRSAHRNLACKDALELSKSCQNGKDLLHPLGNEYQEKANLFNMGELIMRDKDHRHFT